MYLDPTDLAVGEVVACELLGESQAGVPSQLLTAGNRTELEVPPGTYLIRAALPSGQYRTATAHLSADETINIDLTAPKQIPSLAESLPERAYDPGGFADRFSEITPPLQWRLERMLRSVQPSQMSEYLSALSLNRIKRWRSLSDEHLWVRRWQASTSKPRELDPEMIERRYGRPVIRITADRDNDSQLDGVDDCIQFGGMHTIWRVVQLPPARNVTMTLLPASGRVEVDDRVTFRVVGQSPLATAMLGYLCTGQLDYASVIAPRLIDQALSNRSHSAFEDVLVASYYALRTGQSAPWIADIPRELPALADSAIIKAWDMINGRERPDRDSVRNLLLSAAEMPPPRYTEGLRLLYQGLQLLGQPGPDLALPRPSEDPDLRASLCRIKRYAEACDWSAPYTTYWADRPDNPTLETYTGPPTDSKTDFTQVVVYNSRADTHDAKTALRLRKRLLLPLRRLRVPSVIAGDLTLHRQEPPAEQKWWNAEG
ncbi:hypothetical protein [Mycobacterium mantenii]|uniref:hypothetical protein n=1 Tax=Mycobacterium mantenii TaxID=560555 RepID=UPI0010427860|nr:hypothetical protein [Mycobacterium mantenii]